MRADELNLTNGDWYFQIECPKCHSHLRKLEDDGNVPESTPLHFDCAKCGESVEIMPRNCRRVEVKK